MENELILRLTSAQRKQVNEFVKRKVPAFCKWAILGNVLWQEGVVISSVFVGLEADVVNNSAGIASKMRQERLKREEELK